MRITNPRRFSSGWGFSFPKGLRGFRKIPAGLPLELCIMSAAFCLSRLPLLVAVAMAMAMAMPVAVAAEVVAGSGGGGGGGGGEGGGSGGGAGGGLLVPVDLGP